MSKSMVMGLAYPVGALLALSTIGVFRAGTPAIGILIALDLLFIVFIGSVWNPNRFKNLKRTLGVLALFAYLTYLVAELSDTSVDILATKDEVRWISLLMALAVIIVPCTKIILSGCFPFVKSKGKNS